MSAVQIIGLVVAAWLACAVGAAGFAVAYFQGKFPYVAKREYRSDLIFGLLFGLGWGPISLIMAFFLSERCKYGWRLLR